MDGINVKILVLSSAVYNHGYVDTAALHLKELLYHLSEKHKIYVVAQLEHHFSPKKNLEVKNIMVPISMGRSVEGDKDPLMNIVHRAMVAFFSILLGAKVYASFRPDLIYVRHGVNSLSATFLAKLLRKPLVVEVNGLFWSEGVLYGWPKSVILFSELIDFITLRNSCKVIAVTNGIKNALVRKYGLDACNVKVVPNGVDLQRFAPIDKKRAKTVIGLALDTPIVCFVGNLNPIQGVEILIESSPYVLATVPLVKFVIVGDGPLKKEFMTRTEALGVRNAFIFTSKVADEMLPVYINAADVCVTFKKSILSGHSPLKLYEYMACEKPVIASNTNGFEILATYKAGILVDADNSGEVVTAIIKLLTEESLNETMAKNARKAVKEHHDWAMIAKRISEICKSCLVGYS